MYRFHSVYRHSICHSLARWIATRIKAQVYTVHWTELTPLAKRSNFHREFNEKFKQRRNNEAHFRLLFAIFFFLGSWWSVVDVVQMKTKISGNSKQTITFHCITSTSTTTKNASNPVRCNYAIRSFPGMFWRSPKHLFDNPKAKRNESNESLIRWCTR